MMSQAYFDHKATYSIMYPSTRMKEEKGPTWLVMCDGGVPTVLVNYHQDISSADLQLILKTMTFKVVRYKKSSKISFIFS